jgi:hypothetical protein
MTRLLVLCHGGEHVADAGRSSLLGRVLRGAGHTFRIGGFGIAVLFFRSIPVPLLRLRHLFRQHPPVGRRHLQELSRRAHVHLDRRHRGPDPGGPEPLRTRADQPFRGLVQRDLLD